MVIAGETCEWCAGPNTRRSPYCSPLHQQKAKRDLEYFGGHYRDTIGYAERACQVCLKRVDKGGQSHHELGRANDIEGLHLVWLCPGDHSLVTDLARRLAINDTEYWERLIYFALRRKHGTQPTVKVTFDGN